MHSYFDTYREAAVKNLSPNVGEVLDSVYEIAAEDTVLKIEHLLKKLNIDIKG